MSNFSFSEETKELLNNFADVADILLSAFLFKDPEQCTFWYTVRDKIYEILAESED